VLVGLAILHNRRHHTYLVQLQIDGKNYMHSSNEAKNERRIAQNSKAYTYFEFQNYYGKDADEQWANAPVHVDEGDADEVDVELGQGAKKGSKPQPPQGNACGWEFVALFVLWCLVTLGLTLNYVLNPHLRHDGHSDELRFVTHWFLPWALWSGATVFLVRLYSSVVTRINHWYAKAALEVKLEDQLQAVLHEGSTQDRQEFPDTTETSVKADQAVVVKMIRTINAVYHDSSSQTIRRAHIILDPAESVRKGLKLSSMLACLCSPTPDTKKMPK